MKSKLLFLKSGSRVLISFCFPVSGFVSIFKVCDFYNSRFKKLRKINIYIYIIKKRNLFENEERDF